MSAGKQTVHELLGTRVAVLAGDFLFAQSSWYLANLDNLEVIKLISQVSTRQSRSDLCHFLEPACDLAAGTSGERLIFELRSANLGGLEVEQ
jgi:hypothetical protein